MAYRNCWGSPMRLGQLGLALALASPAFAQDIVVTGRPLPGTPGDAAFGVVTIDAARIDSTASNRLEDALRDVAGAQQFRRSDARSANPTSQGVTLRGLGGNAAARALVLLDGVPQGDPFGGFIAWPLYSTARIGAVRVTRGGGSGVSGPGALAGTIEIDSIDAASARGLAFNLSGGERRSVDASALISGKLGGGFGLISGSFARGDGFVPVIASQRGPADVPAPFTQGALAMRGVAPVGATTELQANFSLFDDRRTRGTAFSANRTSGADASVRLVGVGALPFAVLGYVQLRRFASQFASVDAARAVVTPTLDQYDTPATGVGGRIELRPQLGDRLTLRLGVDARRVSGRTQEKFTYVAGNPTRLREAGGSSDTYGAFADASFVTGLLTLTGGGRIDRWWIGTGSLSETGIASGTVLTDARFAPRGGWQPTGRAGVALAATPALTLRGAAYLGWRLPTLNELYRPFRVGTDATAANAALAPETSRGAEIGLTFTPVRHVSVAATTFANRLDDAIANVALGRGPGTFAGVGFVAGIYRQRLNIDAIVSRGIEIDARAALGEWSLAASLAYADARVRATGVAAALDGLRPAGVAPLQASGTLGWRTVSATLRYSSAQFDDDQNQRRLAPALTLDAVADLPLSKRFTVSLRAENVFDRTVEAAVGSTGVLERASARTLWLGLRFRS